MQTRRNVLKGIVAMAALGPAVLACEAIGRRTVVDAMEEKGYELEEASYNGRSGTVVRGFNGKRYGAAGDGPLQNGTKVVLIKVNGKMVEGSFLEDIEAPEGTVIQPVITPFSRGKAAA